MNQEVQSAQPCNNGLLLLCQFVATQQSNYFVSSGWLAMYIMLRFSLNEPATAISDLLGSQVHALPFHATKRSVGFRHSPDCLRKSCSEQCFPCVFH